MQNERVTRCPEPWSSRPIGHSLDTPRQNRRPDAGARAESTCAPAGGRSTQNRNTEPSREATLIGTLRDISGVLHNCARGHRNESAPQTDARREFHGARGVSAMLANAPPRRYELSCPRRAFEAAPSRRPVPDMQHRQERVQPEGRTGRGAQARSEQCAGACALWKGRNRRVRTVVSLPAIEHLALPTARMHQRRRRRMAVTAVAGRHSVSLLTVHQRTHKACCGDGVAEEDRGGSCSRTCSRSARRIPLDCTPTR